MNSANFDVNDKASWYFGKVSRQGATEMLQNQDNGVFLVRDSSTISGEYVLSVREGPKVSHYIINIVENDAEHKFRMGTQLFKDLSDILSFYKVHYLDSTNLIRPVSRVSEHFFAKYDFAGKDIEDLPFSKGEILTIISKDEPQWWTARNSEGKVGQVPVPYIEPLKRRSDEFKNLFTNTELSFRSSSESECRSSGGSVLSKPDLNRPLPALARVRQARVPNAYDQTALKLEVDDIIKVTKTHINGQWEGELNGRKGHFPFTHIEFLEEDLNTQ